MSRATVLWLLLLATGESYGQAAAPVHGSSPLGSLTLNLTVTNNTTCAYNNGIIVATVTGGTPPFTYTSTGLGVTNSTGIFANVSAGAYDVEVTDATGQGASATIPVSNSFIPPFISGQSVDPTGCAKTDGTITLTPIQGLGPFQYSIDDGQTWQKGNTFGNLGTGFYNAWVMDADGCVSAPWSNLGKSYLDYQFYTVRPHYQVLLIPTCGLQLSAVPSGPVCGNNGTITFFAASGGTPPYTYSLDGINFAPNTVHGYTGLGPGQYTVYARDATGLTITIALDIPRDCPVTADLTAATCGQTDGAILVTGANGIAPYTYSIDGINFQVSPNFTGLAPGPYTIVSKDVHGATSSTDVVLQAGCPFVTAMTTNATCGRLNGSITVLAGGAPGPYKYSIDGILFQSSGTFPDLAPGPYTVTVTNAAGLLGTAGATIGDLPGPLISAGTRAASCLGNDGSITVSQQGGTAPFQYSVGGGPFQDNAVFSALDTGMKTVSVRDVNGCLSSQVITVPLLNQLTLDPGKDTTVCEGVGGRLHASSNGISFSWSPVAGLGDPGELNPVATPSVTTSYTITATYGLCSTKGTVTVSVDPAPTADAGPDTIICAGQSVRLQGSGGLGYQWSPAAGLDNAGIPDPVVVRPPASVDYGLVVRDPNGCRSLNTAVVHVAVTPPGKVFAGNDTTVVTNQPLQLHAVDVNGSGFTQYQWSPAGGLNDPFSQDPTVAVTASVTYTVTALTPEGCNGAASITLKVYSIADIFVPNAFTPNGDGHNDVLKAIPAGIRDFKYFSVFSRWGQRVFQTADPDKGWDGSVNGRMQGPGTYIWTALGTDFHGNTVQRRGVVILIR